MMIITWRGSKNYLATCYYFHLSNILPQQKPLISALTMKSIIPSNSSKSCVTVKSEIINNLATTKQSLITCYIMI